MQEAATHLVRPAGLRRDAGRPWRPLGARRPLVLRLRGSEASAISVS